MTIIIEYALNKNNCIGINLRVNCHKIFLLSVENNSNLNMSLDDSFNSDDEGATKEIDSLLKTAVTFSPEYDLNSYDPATAVPMCGDDFLQYVMYESSKCDKVVTADRDKMKLKKMEISKLIDDDFIKALPTQTPSCLIPSSEWQNDQINLFNKLRKRLETLRTNFNENASPTEITRNVDWAVVKCKKCKPSLSEALCVRLLVVIGFVHDLVQAIEEIPTDGSSIPHYLGVWLYTALALLPIPLLPSTCSTLRQLARKCRQLRAALPVDNGNFDGQVQPLNLFICLVGRYFYQIDLADTVI